MDAALGLGVGHPLHPVDPALKFEAAVGPLPVDGKDGLPHPAQLGLAQVEQLHLPAMGGGVHAVHPHQTVGKEGGLLAAHPAAHLDDDAAAVVFVPGQQQHFERLFQLRHRLRFFADLLLYHLFEVRLEGLVPGEQGFCLRQVVPLGPQGPVGRHGRLGLVVFLHQAAESGRVGGRFGLVQPVGQLFKPAADRLHLLIQRQRQGALLSASGVRRARKGR